MAPDKYDQSEDELYPSVEVRWMDPQELQQSLLYDDDPGRGSISDLEASIESNGVLQPVLGRIEEGESAVYDGWRRVEGALASGKKVPVWLPKDGEWTDEKVLLTRLLANTAAHEEEMDWLRRAWTLDNWWNEAGDTRRPSRSKVAEKLNVPEPTARRWLEPVRTEWEKTIVDRNMFDGEQIRQADGLDANLIGGLHIGEILDSLSPPRLMDIRVISSRSDDLRSDRDVRSELLNDYVLGDITYAELKEVKTRVEEDGVEAYEALEEVRKDSPSLTADIDDETAERVQKLSYESGKDEEEIIEQATEQLLDELAVEGNDRDHLTDSEQVGQFSYIEQNVEGSRPEPDLRMESNDHMAALPEESVALTVTSPPYNLNWEYGELASDNRPYPVYMEEVLREPFTEVYHLTISGGYCCIVVPLLVDVPNEDMQTPEGTSIAADVIDVLTDEGWRLFDLIIWDKGFNEAGLRDQEFPYPGSKLNNFAEAIVVLQKPGERDVGKTRQDQSKIIRRGTVEDQDLRDNIWHISPASWEPKYTDTADTAQFPEELAKRCILHWSYVGDTVLDPFSGRGTTLKMAKQLYRESIGFEVQEEMEQDIKEYVGMK